MTDPKSHRDAYLKTVYRAAASPLPWLASRRRHPLRRARLRPPHRGQPPKPRARGGRERRRSRDLAAELERRGLLFGPSYGSDPEDSWREAGFVVWDAGAETVLDLGRRFEQNAVVWGEGERVSLGWCDSGELEGFWPRRAAG
jgi:hypothetical protein